MIDNEFKNYYVLWKWLAILNDPRVGHYAGSKYTELPTRKQLDIGLNTEYQTTLSILALNEYNKTIMEFVYYNAFITSLGGIQYSYRDGEIIETTAEFQFNQLDIIKPKN